MISHISINNVAIIKNTEIDFDRGLNIITGETGAGKGSARSEPGSGRWSCA